METPNGLRLDAPPSPGKLSRRFSLLYRPTIARGIAAAALAYAAYYLVWRATASLDFRYLAFSLLFFLAELYGAIGMALQVLTAWDVDRLLPFVLRRDQRVDVYVLVSDQEIEILEATLTGCSEIAYPHTTYVLDERRRPRVEALAERLGCRYFAKSGPVGGKAAMINTALARTSGDFIAILDGDTVPQPDFLYRTLGYFADKQVGVVQLPQEFYNLDSVQHQGRQGALNARHAESLANRVIQPGRNRWNAAIWTGSPSVVRRDALVGAGGAAMESAVPYLRSSIRLHAQGWKSVYHDEELAYGRAPETLEALSAKRAESIQDSLQLLQSRENPLAIRGLSLGQRLSYLGLLWPRFDPIPSLVFALTPAIMLTLGWVPFRVPATTFLAHWAPYVVLALLTNLALGRGNYDGLAVERQRFLKLFAFLSRLMPRASQDAEAFGAQEGDADATSSRIEQAFRFSGLILAGIAFLASDARGAMFLRGLNPGDLAPGLTLFALAWALFNADFACWSLSYLPSRTYRRRNYRFPISLFATIASRGDAPQAVWVKDLSLSGIGLRAPRDLRLRRDVTVTLRLLHGELSIDGDVVFMRSQANGEVQLGVEFVDVGGASRRQLLEFLFIIGPHLQTSSRGLLKPPSEASSPLSDLPGDFVQDDLEDVDESDEERPRSPVADLVDATGLV